MTKKQDISSLLSKMANNIADVVFILDKTRKEPSEFEAALKILSDIASILEEASDITHNTMNHGGHAP